MRLLFLAHNDEPNNYDGNEKLRHGEAAASPPRLQTSSCHKTITEPLKGLGDVWGMFQMYAVPVRRSDD